MTFLKIVFIFGVWCAISNFTINSREIKKKQHFHLLEKKKMNKVLLVWFLNYWKWHQYIHTRYQFSDFVFYSFSFFQLSRRLMLSKVAVFAFCFWMKGLFCFSGSCPLTFARINPFAWIFYANISVEWPNAKANKGKNDSFFWLKAAEILYPKLLCCECHLKMYQRSRFLLVNVVLHQLYRKQQLFGFSFSIFRCRFN